ncbi:MAG: hypothetical protein ACPLXO_03400 [Desulfurella sp.]|jgi:MinD-like ATPase involved in chromosome partitioning or flagellar assembly|nr:MAG: hypothetical protein C0180_07175 [Aciduliprofundum sp.]
MKILIKKGKKIVWSIDAEISEGNLDVIIEEIKKTIHQVENFEKFGKTEFRDGAVKELTEGWK